MSESNGPPSESPSTQSPRSDRPTLYSAILKCVKEYGPITTDRVVVLCGHYVPVETALRRYEQQCRFKNLPRNKPLAVKIQIGRKQTIHVGLSNLKIAKKIVRTAPAVKTKCSEWNIAPTACNVESSPE